MASSENTVTLGVIGGSGIYEMQGAKIVKEHRITTPFGDPSDSIVEAEFAGRKAFFLPRHGKGHRLLPTEVNYRANIYALKTLGVNHLLAVSAVGIMTEKIARGDMVLPTQIYDRTKGMRANTFFGQGIVGHVSFAEPFCKDMQHLVAKNAKTCGARVHEGGTYICMEGPAFSTKAESMHYRKTIDAAVIGMTAIPEAKLAREAEMCYTLLALATDYDCWHETEEEVSIEAVLKVLKDNAALANRIVQETIQTLPKTSNCKCQSAAQYSILTAMAVVPEATKKNLAPLYGKYFG